MIWLFSGGPGPPFEAAAWRFFRWTAAVLVLAAGGDILGLF